MFTSAGRYASTNSNAYLASCWNWNATKSIRFGSARSWNGKRNSWQAIAARSDRGATFCLPYPRVVGPFLHDWLSVATSEALRAFHCVCQLRKEDLNVAGGSLSGRAGAPSWFDGMDALLP